MWGDSPSARNRAEGLRLDKQLQSHLKRLAINGYENVCTWFILCRPWHGTKVVFLCSGWAEAARKLSRICRQKFQGLILACMKPSECHCYSQALTLVSFRTGRRVWRQRLGLRVFAWFSTTAVLGRDRIRFLIREDWTRKSWDSRRRARQWRFCTCSRCTSSSGGSLISTRRLAGCFPWWCE